SIHRWLRLHLVVFSVNAKRSSRLNETGVMIEVRNDSLTKIRGEIKGPPDSPYEHGTYSLDITIPDEYPFQPPVCKFITKIWHPNISSQTGTICLDILKEQWAASLTLRTVLLSIQALLTLPEPKDPQDAVVAKQFLDSPALFNRTAKFWTQHYANASGPKDEELWKKVDKLVDMGVSQDQAISALSCNQWDLSKATDYVFG
uniref:E2 ubiquitin-conjugating enzyme n=2 Tax=Parascaris univalens TaxID=6257 RepID=A0A915B8A0_PARUN